jgi:hypothetical protein
MTDREMGQYWRLAKVPAVINFVIKDYRYSTPPRYKLFDSSGKVIQVSSITLKSWTPKVSLSEAEIWDISRC